MLGMSRPGNINGNISVRNPLGKYLSGMAGAGEVAGKKISLEREKKKLDPLELTKNIIL